MGMGFCDALKDTMTEEEARVVIMATSQLACYAGCVNPYLLSPTSWRSCITEKARVRPSFSVSESISLSF
jgi:hypothetical protein